MNEVTIIGLGPMGQAMAKTYLNNGYKVSLWNRTKSKADNLVKEGCFYDRSITEVIKRSQLILVSLTNYDVFWSILENLKTDLNGKVIVNLSSGTPQEAREVSQWIIQQGGSFLSAGIMVPPSLVGKDDPNSYTFYSGPKKLFEQYQADLAVLTTTDYKGEDVGLAMLYYQAMLNILYTSMTGVIQSYALLKAGKINAIDFEPYTHEFLKFLPTLIQQANIAVEIDTKNYDGSQQNLKMMLAGAKHVTETAKEANIDFSVPKSIEALFQNTVNDGFGGNSTASIFETLYANGD
ncbi:MAG: 6-phosphogluconate dehydrogenase [Sphingobacterium sp.]|jgi:3-hydroxyisobutyrate dehydrogenase-like beta-hydroxyacid dehydrogenase|nr:6-phosphogluconate dehydrogenase [Sphingobacterium sp.]